jgi:hypothetical protein
MKPKNIFIVILILGVLLLVALLKKDILEKGLLGLIRNHPYVQGLVKENSRLSAELQSRVTISNNNVRIVYRDHDVVREVKIYVPAEGNVSVLTPSSGTVKPGWLDGIVNTTYTVPGSSTVVVVKRMGFTFRPQLSCLMNEQFDLHPNLDARIFFYDRWGLVAGVWPRLIVSVDRRIDDLVPLIHNTTFGLYYSISTREYGIRCAVFL